MNAISLDKVLETYADLYWMDERLLNFQETLDTVFDNIRDIPTQSVYSAEDVAEILADILCDECACDFNGIDEWLPAVCKYADTECPHPKDKHGCWMQYLEKRREPHD